MRQHSRAGPHPCAPAPRSTWPRCAPTCGPCAPTRRRAALMAVVKSDAYGHGAVPCARAARRGRRHLAGHRHARGGARAAGRRAAGTRHVLAVDPGRALARGLEADIDVSVSGHVGAARRSSAAARARAARARAAQGRHRPRPQRLPARATGPSWSPRPWRAEAAGLIRVTGLWSHFACADEPGHPSIAAQLARLPRDGGVRRGAGRAPRGAAHRQLARHADPPRDATSTWSGPGIALYGVSPSPEIGSPADFGLRPVMTLPRSLALVKHVPGGHGVSYGHHYVTPGETTLGLVPARLRGRHPAACLRHRPGPGRRQVADGRGPGRHGPVRRRPRRRRARARRRGACCSGPATGASPPPRTGRRRRAPSRTRS